MKWPSFSHRVCWKVIQHQQYKNQPPHDCYEGYFNSDVTKVEVRRWNTDWAQNRVSNLLMNTTSEFFPEFPTLSFPFLPKKKEKEKNNKSSVFNECYDSGVSSNSNQWTPPMGSEYPGWCSCQWRSCLATQVCHHDFPLDYSFFS